MQWTVGGGLIVIGVAIVAFGVRNFTLAATPVPSNEPVRAAGDNRHTWLFVARHSPRYGHSAPSKSDGSGGLARKIHGRLADVEQTVEMT